MSFFLLIKYWLVEHPSISTFEWIPGTTLGSTPTFLLLSISLYLSLTFLLLRLSPPPLPPRLLRLISALHNLLILLLSLTMALGCSLSAPSTFSHLFCFPANNRTPPRGPLFFWAYVFYLSKTLEFLDTFLIILGGNTRRRLSFLHVYHHSTVLLMCYIWLNTSQSLFPVALVTNSAVHSVMYGYYLMCTLGIRPSWKRLVTDCQIIQFVFSFVVSGVMIYYHLFKYECSGIKGWCFNAAFNASLLYLFIDFHSKSYSKREVIKGGDKDDIKIS